VEHEVPTHEAAPVGEAVREVPQTSDMPTFQVAENRLTEVLRFLKLEATPRFQRLDDLTAIDESARRSGTFIGLHLVYTCYPLNRPADRG
jgi:NADH-quinone oxidoreductase subunit B/C/D